MLYATHEDRRTHRSMQCSSETTSSLKFTWPIKIASKVISESWGGEQDSPWLRKAASLPEVILQPMNIVEKISAQINNMVSGGEKTKETPTKIVKRRSFKASSLDKIVFSVEGLVKYNNDCTQLHKRKELLLHVGIAKKVMRQ